jgi:glutathione synthase/RimK-type ligase-like ATP-grasp enzyme
MISGACDTGPWCNPRPMTDVLLATDAQNSTLLDDDHFLVDALSALGFNAVPAVWNDPTVDWGSARAVVLRSVFDYTSDCDRFLEWTERVEAVTTLHNPASLVRWNSHKSYLRELESRGVPIVPTEWVVAGTKLDLAALMEERGWSDAVVKPTIGNGARGAQRVTAADGQTHLDALVVERDAMIQPYLPATEEPGEHALIHIGGRFSHAIRKDQMLAGRPFSFDRTPPTAPDPRELELASKVLEGISESPLLYARVDTLIDGDVVVRLMELEVIEPVLFFTKAPGAAERMAEEIAARL